MAGIILGAGGLLQWSKIKIAFNLLPYDADGERVIIDLYDSGDFIISLNYPANIGTLLIDLQPILKNYPKPLRPALKSGLAFISTPQAQEGVKELRIYYRLSSWAEPGFLVNKKIVFGGWDNMDFISAANPNSYITMDASKFFCNKGLQTRILSHFPSGRIMDAGEHGWVSYLQEIDAIPFQKVRYFITYVDGGNDVVYKYFPSLVGIKDTTWHIPMGIQQLALDPTSRGVRELDMYVDGGDDGEIILCHYNVKYDNRPCYQWLDVQYRNSLGGWDHFRLKHNIEFTSDFERKEYENKPPDKFGSNNNFDSDFRLKWKAATGYIPRQMMVALTDLVNSTDICILWEGSWLPVKCMTKNFKWNDTKDSLHNEFLEFESAGRFNVIPQQLMQFFSKAPELR